MICGVIPARKSSKRIPNKNIVKLAGKPLIEHTIDFCNKFDLFTEVFISTDCKKIAGYSKGIVKAPFLRPEELASDHSTDKEWISHFIDWLTKGNKDYSHIMILRPTSPLRPPALMRQAIELSLINNSPLRSVSKVPNKMVPEWMILSRENGYGAEFIQRGFEIRSQDLNSYYYPNGLFDIVCIKEFLKTGKIYGERFLLKQIPEELVNDIDTVEDLEYMERNWHNLIQKAVSL